MAKTIILCADDFGQDSHISQGILTLAKADRISAISCMTTEEDWTHHGSALKALKNSVDRGLHFNLTHGEGSHIRPLSYWLMGSVTRRLDTIRIKETLNEQIDRFMDVMGCPPDFIDGHQHVHSFPLIRNVLINVIKERFQHHKPYVRVISPMLHGGGSKLKWLVSQGLSFGFASALKRAGIAYNSGFGGIYNLQAEGLYRNYMHNWLQHATSGTLIMCHPGVAPQRPTTDPHPASRVEEYDYFLSQAFLEDCLQVGVSLGRFSHNSR